MILKKLLFEIKTGSAGIKPEVLWKLVFLAYLVTLKIRLYLDACGTESYIYGGSSYFHPQYTQIAKNDANGNFYSTAPETDPQIYLVSQSDYPYPFSAQQKWYFSV